LKLIVEYDDGWIAHTLNASVTTVDARAWGATILVTADD
jgi:hypothetical protein